MSFIYLASPYTDASSNVMQERATQVERVCASLMQQGEVIFSPIAHGHAITKHLPAHMQRDKEFWMRQATQMLAKASHLYVLRLPGWETSTGVATEIALAKAIGLPITYIQRI